MAGVTNEVSREDSASDATSLARGSSLSLLGSVGSAVLSMVLILVVTWGLGTDDGGAFFEAIAFFNIAIIAVAIGADTGLLRFTSRSLALPDAPRQNQLLTIGLVPVLVVGTVVAVASSLLAPTLGRALGGDGHADQIGSMIRVISWFIPVGALNVAVLGASRGYGTMLPTVVADRIGRPALQLVLTGAAVLLGISAGWLAAVWAIPFLLSLLAGAIWLQHLRLQREESHDGKPLGETVREFWAFTLPRALASMFRVGVLWLDVLLVGALMSPRDAAIYTVATRLIQAGFLATDAIGQAVEPMFSSLLARGHADRTHNVYQVATSWLISLTWPPFLAAWIFAPTVLGLFGPEFREASPVVAILAGSALLGSGFGSIDILLVMAGKSVWSLWNSGAALVTNVVLNLILIPTMGLNGAALAWAISRVISNVLPFLEMRSLLGINPIGRRWWIAAGISVGTFGLIGLIMRIGLGSNIGVIGLYLVTAGAAYAFLTWRWRGELDLVAFAGLLGKRLRRDTGGTS
jgi:O-antigen/teichoic acid export membrane protein